MDFSTVIDFEKEKGSFYLVDSNTDGSFFVHYMLSHGIKSNSNTILITFSQTLGHYKGVQAKLGNSSAFNLNLSTGNLVHFDLLSKLSLAYAENQTKILNDLFEKIELIVKQKEKEEFFLIIDDLSVASLYGIAEQELFTFLSKVQCLSDRVCLMVYVQSMLSTRNFINDLIYMCDFYFKIENLSTGYSKEIDGQVN